MDNDTFYAEILVSLYNPRKPELPECRFDRVRVIHVSQNTTVRLFFLDNVCHTIIWTQAKVDIKRWRLLSCSTPEKSHSCTSSVVPITCPNCVTCVETAFTKEWYQGDKLHHGGGLPARVTGESLQYYLHGVLVCEVDKSRNKLIVRDGGRFLPFAVVTESGKQVSVWTEQDVSIEETVRSRPTKRSKSKEFVPTLLGCK